MVACVVRNGSTNSPRVARVMIIQFVPSVYVCDSVFRSHFARFRVITLMKIRTKHLRLPYLNDPIDAKVMCLTKEKAM